MTRFVARRLVIAVVQVAAITIAVFLLIRALPADPVATRVGFNASPDVYRKAKSDLGLDRSTLSQLGTYLGGSSSERGLLAGNLGTSWASGSTVASEIGDSLPVTLELISLSFLLAGAIAIPLGMRTARRPGKALDKAVFGYGLFAGAAPEFWWGLMLVFVFYFKLGWAPAPLGRLSPQLQAPTQRTGAILVDSLLAGRLDAFWDGLKHLVLPVVTLAFILSGPIMKMVRQSTTRVLGSDFVLYAQAAGLPPRQVSRSTLRAAFGPVLTLIGILYGFMLGGAVLVESVFSLGGLGQYSVKSVLEFNYPSIQGVVLVITVLSLVIYLVLDVLLAMLDPRARQR